MFFESFIRIIQLCFTKFCCIEPFSYFPGGGWGKIENKDHLSPAEAETRAELGKNSKRIKIQTDRLNNITTYQRGKKLEFLKPMLIIMK